MSVVRSKIIALSISVLALSGAPAQHDPGSAPTRIGVGFVQRKLALAEAVAAAVHNNLDVELERTNVATAQEAVNVVRGAFDPGIRYLPLLENRNTPTGSILQGAGGKLNDRFFNNNVYFRDRVERYGTSFGVDFENSRQATTNPFSSFTPLLTSRLAFTFTQPLLRNFRTDPARAEIQVRRKQVDVAAADFELRVIDVVARVEQAYYDLVAARQDRQVEDEAVELARQQLATNQRLVSSGSLAPVELAAAEAELQRRLDTYFGALQRVTETENALKVLVAGSRLETIWNDEIIPVDTQVPVSPQADDLNQVVTAALRKRPELRRVALTQDVNAIQQSQNENARKPQLDLVAQYSLNGLGGNLRLGDNPLTASNNVLYSRLNDLSSRAGLPPLQASTGALTPDFLVGSYGTSLYNLFSGRYQSVQVGVQLDLNLKNHTANGLLAQNAIAAKRLKYEQARTEQAIEAQVRNSLQALQSTQQRITAATASVRAAKEKLESETRLFQSGESTNFLVLTRQNELSDSRRRAVVAQLDYNRGISRLQQALGTTLDTYQVTVK